MSEQSTNDECLRINPERGSPSPFPGLRLGPRSPNSCSPVRVDLRSLPVRFISDPNEPVVRGDRTESVAVAGERVGEVLVPVDVVDLLVKGRVREHLGETEGGRKGGREEGGKKERRKVKRRLEWVNERWWKEAIEGGWKTIRRGVAICGGPAEDWKLVHREEKKSNK